MKTSYHQFNSQEILQKEKKTILKKKLLIFIKTITNKELKKSKKNKCKNTTEEEKNKIKEYQ